ncbi:methyl-accepting chemotaxis protein [Methylomagnum ishizawai]|uniref:methyl-accepting chemotaxis protein n=1 Tax=Methylomagnum ishizawai TaxID=1760988 RepID=UPI001C33DFFB|nr:HAMP domain-containing methyl-accepting chemotaxis protein [Methylomagnum ishizawai]BBL75271.1 hypothetical protein MishRS11D_23690 [Methylomagnum ishizawai]
MIQQRKPFGGSPLGRLSLARKFMILGLIAFVSIAFPLSLYFNELQQDIDASALESRGTAPLMAAFKATYTLQISRGMAKRFLDNEKEADLFPPYAKKSLDLITSTDAVVKRDVADPAIVAQWESLAQDWRTLLKQVNDRQIDEDTSFKWHDKLASTSIQLTEKLFDHFRLSQDSGPEHFLIVTLQGGMLQTIDAISDLRGAGRYMLEAKQASPADKVKLSINMDLIRYRMANLLQAPLLKAFARMPEAEAELAPQLAETIQLAETVLETTRREIIDAPQVNYPVSSWRKVYDPATAQFYTLTDAILEVLDTSLKSRVAKARAQQTTTAAFMLVFLVVGVVFAVLIVRSITVPVGHLIGVIDRLAKGDGTVRADLETSDEIGQLGRQFDRMAGQLWEINAQIKLENETLNNSMIELLQAVAGVAQNKDLTVQLPVAEDITGLVADALNLLSGETAKVLVRVNEIAQSVARVSQEVKSQADTIIQVATEEKREVEQAATELTEASTAMRDISLLAQSCNEAAEKAIRNTDKAQEAVLNTVQGITSIRDTIRETEKRIKRLGERSQEIGGAVSLINSIAERTHILALNASMHAASAGEAGRGFAVVANEVQRLAENAREATSKISSLVNNIQVETVDTVTTMNEAISQVVEGTKLAQQAGGEMRGTRDTTADLVLLVQRIAASSTTQAQTAQRLLERAVQIQKSTEHTYRELQDQGRQTERLVDFSGNLVESVGVFTLPAPAVAG